MKKFLNLKGISREFALVLSVCDDLDCDSGISNVVIPCKGKDFGKRIVKFFFARDDAADFASEASLNTQADWATRLALPVTGVGSTDRIVAVGDVHDGVKPAEANTTEPAPYGGDELIESKQTVTFAIKRWDEDLIDSINSIRCFVGMKMWYLTDTGYLFGGVTGHENTSTVWGTIQHPGNGGGRVKSDNTITWISADQSVPVYNPWLATMNN